MSSIDILKPFHRQFSGPLDTTSVFNKVNDNNKLVYVETNGTEKEFDDADSLANYYATRAIAYCGQIIAVVDPRDNSSNLYVITGSDDDISNRTAESIGSADGITVDYCNEIPIN